MVECTGLENRQRRKTFVSSNLTASASRFNETRMAKGFAGFFVDVTLASVVPVILFCFYLSDNKKVN